MFNALPESPHRAALRALADAAEAHRLTVQQALRPLTLHLRNRDQVLDLGVEWTDLAPVPARLRILAQLPALGDGAFVAEVEYALNAELDTVAVAEAVAGLVLAGAFLLRRLEEPECRIAAGGSFQLAPHETHGWACQGHVRSLLVFTPAPGPDPSGCAYTPDPV